MRQVLVVRHLEARHARRGLGALHDADIDHGGAVFFDQPAEIGQRRGWKCRRGLREGGRRDRGRAGGCRRRRVQRDVIGDADTERERGGERQRHRAAFERVRLHRLLLEE